MSIVQWMWAKQCGAARHSETGASMVEYAMVLTLIVVVVLVVVNNIGHFASDAFTSTEAGFN